LSSFTEPANSQIYPLSLHDALPISGSRGIPRTGTCSNGCGGRGGAMRVGIVCPYSFDVPGGVQNHVRDLAETLIDLGHEVSVLRSEEHTSELQSPYDIVCRLLLEKK